VLLKEYQTSIGPIYVQNPTAEYQLIFFNMVAIRAFQMYKIPLLRSGFS